MSVPAGTLIANQYEILGPLGRGGMGEIFRARNVRTERRVALKLLRADAKAKADVVERFKREARAAGMITSDHVTQVLGVEDDAKHGIAIAFELLEGESLLERLRRLGPMTFDTLFPMVEQVLRGLQDAHAVQIIHRDLKPSNVFLEQRPDGTQRVKLLDFGISKLPKTVAKTTLTEPGQALGSFMFMPPEQIQRAANVDQRADIYALGTLVFQSLTGHLPYQARNMVELIQQKTNSEPRTLEQVSGKQFNPQLQAWVSKALKLKPEDRFQTAAEAAAAWKALAAPQPGIPVGAPGKLPVGYAPLPPGRSAGANASGAFAPVGGSPPPPAASQPVAPLLMNAPGMAPQAPPPVQPAAQAWTPAPPSPAPPQAMPPVGMAPGPQQFAAPATAAMPGSLVGQMGGPPPPVAYAPPPPAQNGYGAPKNPLTSSAPSNAFGAPMQQGAQVQQGAPMQGTPMQGAPMQGAPMQPSQQGVMQAMYGGAMQPPQALAHQPYAPPHASLAPQPTSRKTPGWQIALAIFFALMAIGVALVAGYVVVYGVPRH